MPPTTAVRIKAQSDTTITVEGYGVIFGGKDLYGDTFTPETDFELDYVPTKAVLYDHRTNNIPASREIIGKVTSIKKDDTGLLVEAELEKKARWMEVVEELLADNALGWSSGSIGHMVDYEGSVIKKWPIVEFSLTPTPAEPRTMAPYGPGIQRKSADEVATSGSEAAAEGAAEAETQSAPVQPEAPVAVIRNEVADTQEGIMPEEIKAAEAQPDVKSLVESAVAEAMKKLDVTPVKSAGYAVNDDKVVETEKRFNDFLNAVRQRDVAGVKAFYSRNDIKTLEEGTGSTGGYLVPEQFTTTIMGLSSQSSPIVDAVTKFNVTSPAGSIPSLDIFTAPEAGVGDTAMAGGVKGRSRVESGSYTATEPAFRQTKWNVSDFVSGIIPVNRELRQDSPIDLNQLMTVLIGNTLAAKLEYAILRGTGVGQPLGIFYAPAKIDVTPATNAVFAMADASAMRARFKRFGPRETSLWVYHDSLVPDIDAIAAAGGSTVTFITPTDDLYPPLRGYRMVDSEHVAQADASGCIMLADFSAYTLFLLGGLYIDFDEFYDFDNGLSAWRFGYRADGKPWLNSAITLAGPGSAYTKSAFINFND